DLGGAADPAGLPGLAGAPGSGCAPDPADSAAAMGLRTTTGGIGREPGMLIRIRVVNVVSVLGPSVSSAGVGGFDVTVFLFPSGPFDWPVPYGGVPEGYAAPPRPWGPEDELSVSRLKAGSPGWLRRPSYRARAARRRVHHTGRRRGATVSRRSGVPAGARRAAHAGRAQPRAPVAS
ncbi:hypothetical protein GPJ59_34775, partial [Streptomyces bambusae]|nr:hypothetical protein [Streptomyces bambusae]